MPTHFVNSSHMTLEPTKELTPTFTVSSFDKFMVFKVKEAEFFRLTSEGEVYVRGVLVTSDMDIYLAFKNWISLAQVAQQAPAPTPSTDV